MLERKLNQLGKQHDWLDMRITRLENENKATAKSKHRFKSFDSAMKSKAELEPVSE